MKYKLVIPIIILSVILSGCLSEETKNVTDMVDEKITIKYLGYDPIIVKEDFPDFSLLDRVYFIAQENMTVSLEIEGIHGENVVNSTDKIPNGYRIYGVSEAYNSSKNTDKYGRYLLLQYKVFDSNDRLNDSLNLTAVNYLEAGFKSKILSNDTLENKDYKGRIFVFESNTTNRTDVNVTIILFGYDNLLGKIGVQDSTNRSFAEAMTTLDMVFERLEINTKKVEPARIDMFDYRIDNMSYNKTNISTHYGAYN